jgi:hypothetical protein
MYEGIYLIEKYIKKTDTYIYKLGRSFNLSERLKRYPKESKLHLIILCKKSIDNENNIINILTKKFQFISSEIRCEYFMGQLNEIVKEFENYFNKINCIFFKITNSFTNKFNVNNIFYDDNIIKNVYNPINDKDLLINQINYFISDNRVKHICKLCDFITIHKGDYDKHLLTNKHKKNYNKTKKEKISVDITNNLMEKILQQNAEIIKQNEELKKEIQKLKNNNIR